MKAIIFLFFCSVAALLLPISTRAAVFSRDWKALADGLLTYDNINNREWLDLTQTRMSGYVGDIYEGRYQDFLSDLAPGEKFAGFTIAKSEDLIALAASAGINVSSLDDYSTNETPTELLMQLVGVSVRFDTTDVTQSFGLLDEILDPPPRPYRKLGLLASAPLSGPNGQAGVTFSIPDPEDFVAPEVTGVWLFRTVPEPHSLLLWCLAVISFVVVVKARDRVCGH